MGFDMTITRINHQQLTELQRCATAFLHSSYARESLGFLFGEPFTAGDPLIGIKPHAYQQQLYPVPWLVPIEEGISFEDCQQIEPTRVFKLPIDDPQQASLSPFDGFYATTKPVDYPAYIDSDRIYKRIYAVLQQRRTAYSVKESIECQQSLYDLSYKLNLWTPIEELMQALVAEKLIDEWPIIFFADRDKRVVRIGDFQLDYSGLYVISAVKIPALLHNLNSLPRELLKQRFLAQRLDFAPLETLWCWELQVFEELTVLVQQAYHDHDSLVWHIW